MENPRKEIAGVVKGLCSAKNADEQRDTMQRYFVSDASFDHPMCAVMSYENSRDTGVLPIYQWLRVMFMDTLIEVHDIGLDAEKNVLFVNVTQTLRCNLSWIRRIWSPSVNIVVKLDLVKGKDDKYYIKRQVDLYSIQEVFAIFVPYARQIIGMIKIFFGFMCLLLALPFQSFGFWKPSKP